MASALGKKDFLACCGSKKFAEEMVQAGPFANYQEAVAVARDIWFNKVDVHGCLEAFAAHPQIGEIPSSTHISPTSAQWSKGEQSTALATATGSSLQELYDWNSLYRQKFGFIFLICASGRSTPEILAELKKRFSNRPIIELEIAAQEQMKITELRLCNLFPVIADAASKTGSQSTTNDDDDTKADEVLVTFLGGQLAATLATPNNKPSQITTRTRPPITTHILDVAHGCPAAGIEVQLEMWRTDQPSPMFGDLGAGKWISLGSSTTDKDGRSGHLMSINAGLSPGIFRISFNTGKYNPNGFFPYVSIVFEIREYQKLEHFHVPLLLSPFSFSTYRGS